MGSKRTKKDNFPGFGSGVVVRDVPLTGFSFVIILRTAGLGGVDGAIPGPSVGFFSSLDSRKRRGGCYQERLAARHRIELDRLKHRAEKDKSHTGQVSRLGDLWQRAKSQGHMPVLPKSCD
jgi:hypothetical protein